MAKVSWSEPLGGRWPGHDRVQEDRVCESTCTVGMVGSRTSAVCVSNPPMGNHWKLRGVTLLGARLVPRGCYAAQLGRVSSGQAAQSPCRQSSIKSLQPHATLFDARYAQLFKVNAALSAGHSEATALAIPLAHDSKEASSKIERGLWPALLVAGAGFEPATSGL